MHEGFICIFLFGLCSDNVTKLYFLNLAYEISLNFSHITLSILLHHLAITVEVPNKEQFVCTCSLCCPKQTRGTGPLTSIVVLIIVSNSH